MSGDGEKLNGGRPSPGNELQPLLRKLDALVTMLGVLAESNAELAATVAELLDGGADDEPERPEEPEQRGGYIG